MGQGVDRTTFSRRDRQRYRMKVHRCLDALATMLREHPFAHDEPMTGIEVELNLVDADLRPALTGVDVLEAIGSADFQTELGRWNLELNLPPRPLPGDEWRHLEHHLLDELAVARAKARDCKSQLVMIGILPTLRREDMVSDAISQDERYTVLNEQMLTARGEPIRIDITGDDASGRHDVAPDRLVADFDTIIPEAACTSMQLHLQVSPDDFASYWNAAQCLAGVQLAVGANSPFLLGSRLWAETRIPLFEQSCDVRSPELHNQGVRPRVWFGERWITSILDLFSENARYFPGLMPLTHDSDPLADLEAGRVPGLDELRLHNGTIWRWNRPVYDISDGSPHVRVENRVLPAGPTAVDMVANALFFYGLLRVLVEADRPLWSSMSFEAAEENFTTAARHGLDGPLYWPGSGWIRPDELVLRKLLPQAQEGLARWGVSGEVVDRYLSVIERRCVTRRTGAVWQLDAVAALEAGGADRETALHGMLARYLEQSDANEPVHSWALPS
ncbi:MAG: glutamate--cysteine ligase [Pseudonocardia sp.]|uniref:glutamate--cysteine ligase n=1 Tax=unclassified Pseudonocardia TaxID=2619320 RepID=UPI00086F8F93|nr:MULTISPECIES: glutamate--cysteine ligase [unclassified Pseudonocardia]MBN9112653.1 glutamate--cysteine ligase [Pseudonocardia sp.]ODV00532.1 MAG: glutamate--cysteine ligase [Pseudonocardia sp. SCN 73-27]